jgi:hypothetical protein
VLGCITIASTRSKFPLRSNLPGVAGVIWSLNVALVMKFEFEKVGNYVELRMKQADKADRLEEVCLNKNVYIRNQVPTKEELENTINFHVNLSGESIGEITNGYYWSRKKVIEDEIRNIIKSYMRIQQSVQCIDLIDQIPLGSENDK